MSKSPATALAAIRVAVGVGAFAAPALTSKLFGLGTLAGNEQGHYIARLFGVRDIALAAGATAAKGSATRTWLQIGVACDAADVFSAVTAYKRGGVTAPSVAMLAGTAAIATGLGIAALQE